MGGQSFKHNICVHVYYIHDIGDASIHTIFLVLEPLQFIVSSYVFVLLNKVFFLSYYNNYDHQTIASSQFALFDPFK